MLDASREARPSPLSGVTTTSLRTYLVAQIFTSWNRIVDWLGQIDGLQQAA